MPPRRLDRLHLDQEWSVRPLQVANDLADRSHDGGHCQSQTVNTSTSVLAIPNVVHPRVPHRSALVRAVELAAVPRQQCVVATAMAVREEKPVLLALPADVLHVVNLVAGQQVPKRLDKLYRDIFVEKQPHV